MYSNWKIDWFSFNSATGGYDNTPTSTLSNYHDVVLRTGLGDVKDTFDFKMTNNNGQLNNVFNNGDKFIISREVNTSTFTSESVLMTGVSNDVPFDNETLNIQRISGANYSETLANAIVFVGAGDTLDVSSFIQEALRSVAVYNDLFQVRWHPSNPILKTDNTPFPNAERWYNKSINLLLEKYSSKVINKDTNYYWYIDKDNFLIWRPMSTGTIYSFDSTQDNYLKLKSKKDTKGIVNFVIMKGDLSPSGKVIQTRVDNAVSRVKNGYRPYIITSSANYSRELVELDRSSNPTTFDEGDSVPNSFPFTTSWKSRIARASSPTMVVNSPVTVSNSKQYNVAITLQATYELQQEADRFLQARGDGKLQVEILFQPGSTPSSELWRIGDIISVTIPELGFANTLLRVQTAEYATTSDSYTLIQDEVTI